MLYYNNGMTNLKLKTTDCKTTALRKLGYKITPPDIFLEVFVKIWNDTYSTKITIEQARYYVQSFIESIIIFFDNSISVSLRYFAIFESSVNDWRLNNYNKNYNSRFKEDNKDVRIKIRGKLKRYIKKNINPDEAYQNFLLEKEEVKALMFKLRAERKANVCEES